VRGRSQPVLVPLFVCTAPSGLVGCVVGSQALLGEGMWAPLLLLPLLTGLLATSSWALQAFWPPKLVLVGGARDRGLGHMGAHVSPLCLALLSSSGHPSLVPLIGSR
jgi:hypothetical protein